MLSKLNYLLRITLGFFLSQGLFFSTALAESNTSPKKIVVAVLDDGQTHEKKIVNALKILLKNCKICEVRTYPIYKANGDLTASQFINAINKATQEADVLNLSWNITSDQRTIEFEKVLQAAVQKKLIVAAAGAPEGAKLRQPLADTVVGKTKGAFIIGELNAQGRLHMHSYEGAEMLTALTPVEGETGSSFSVLKLTATIANELANGKTETEIKGKLINKKTALPTLEELGFK